MGGGGQAGGPLRCMQKPFGEAFLQKGRPVAERGIEMAALPLHCLTRRKMATQRVPPEVTEGGCTTNL